jgi:hypothetical protein
MFPASEVDPHLRDFIAVHSAIKRLIMIDQGIRSLWLAGGYAKDNRSILGSSAMLQSQ